MAPQLASPTAPSTERIPPYSEEAERAELGALLLDAERVLDLCVESQISVPECFYVPAHQTIYQALLDMANDNRPVDILTTAEHLREKGKLEQIGGTSYLDYLVDATPSAAHAEYYIDIVRQNHILRSIIQRSRAAIDHCYAGDWSADEVLGKVEQDIFEISHERELRTASWPELIKTAMDEIEHIYQTKKGLTGVTTGYRDLDRKLLGLHKGDMVILAARPSMGKTALALNIAERVATPIPEDPVARPVAIFSLEMASEQLIRRMLCCHARVPAYKLYGGYIGDISHADLTQAAAALRKAPIYLDDTAGLTPLELRSRARRLQRKYQIELIMIDYLQMMQFPQKNDEGRQREVAAISSAIKAMAKELDIPVLVLSQLSRAPESRERDDRKPRLSDLRESGALEQDADVVCLLRRPYVYNREEEQRTLAIVDVAKQRNGPTGEVTLHFDDEYMRFEDAVHGVDTDVEPDFEVDDAGGPGG